VGGPVRSEQVTWSSISEWAFRASAETVAGPFRARLRGCGLRGLSHRSSTGEDGSSLLNAAVSRLPPRVSSGAEESTVAPPTASPTRPGDRRLSVRCIESPDTDLLQRRWQQLLNVAQQPRISCRDE